MTVVYSQESLTTIFLAGPTPRDQKIKSWHPEMIEYLGSNLPNAVPAAFRISLPEANLAYPLGLSLGVTFPFNLLLGIAFYCFLATLIFS